MSQNELQRVVAEMRVAVKQCEGVDQAAVCYTDVEDWASRIESAQAVAPGGGEVCRWFADGPEASFFAQEHAHAENLIIRAGFDRDEWTITDLTAAPASEAVGGREAVAWRQPTPYGVGYSFVSEEVMKDMADWLLPDTQPAASEPAASSYPPKFERNGSETTDAADLTAAGGHVETDDYRVCNYCGCNTNAKLRRCCNLGYLEDKAASSAVGEHDEHCDFMAFSTGNPECTCKPDDFHGEGRDNKRQPQGTTFGSSPGYSRPPHHTDRFELDEGDRMTLRCALVSFSEELKRDGLGTDDHGVKMTASYLARISRLLTRINNSSAECRTCNGLGIVGGVSGQTPESMEQVTENCPDCSDDVTAGGTSSSDDELPGMWSHADFTGGATDAEQEQAGEGMCHKGQAFKDYVHQRLDAMGLPHSVPESEHDKAGCRIGGRLDFVEGRIATSDPVGVPEGIKVGGLSIMQGEDDIPTLMYQGAAVLRFERGSWAEAVCLLHPELAPVSSVPLADLPKTGAADGGPDELEYICASLGAMFKGDTLDAVDAGIIDRARALLRRAARVEVTEKLASQVCAAYMCQMEGAISFTPSLPAIKAMERALTKALELGK